VPNPSSPIPDESSTNILQQRDTFPRVHAIDRCYFNPKYRIIPLAGLFAKMAGEFSSATLSDLWRGPKERPENHEAARACVYLVLSDGAKKSDDVVSPPL